MGNELKDLTKSAALIGSLALIVLMVIAVLLGFETSLRQATTGAADEITVATNGSVTNFGVIYGYVTAVTGCKNATDATDLLAATNYTVYNGGNSGGGFTLSDSGSDWVGEDINCTAVTYSAATIASRTVPIFIVGLGIFAAFVGVIALAIIGTTVKKLFDKK